MNIKIFFKDKIKLKAILLLLVFIAIINFKAIAETGINLLNIRADNTSTLPINFIDAANLKFDTRRSPDDALKLNTPVDIDYKISPRPLYIGAELVFVVDAACPSWKHSEGLDSKFLNSLMEAGKLIKEYSQDNKNRISLVVFYTDKVEVVKPDELKVLLSNNDGSLLFNKWNQGKTIDDYRHNLGKALSSAYSFLTLNENRIYDSNKNDIYPVKHIIALTNFRATGDPEAINIASFQDMEYVRFMIKSISTDFSNNIYTHILTSEKDYGNLNSIYSEYNTITDLYSSKAETIKVTESTNNGNTFFWTNAVKSIFSNTTNINDSFALKNNKFVEDYDTNFTCNTSTELINVINSGNKIEGYFPNDVVFQKNSQGYYEADEVSFTINLTPKCEGDLLLPSKLTSSYISIKNEGSATSYNKYLNPSAFTVDKLNFITTRKILDSGLSLNNEFTIEYSFKPTIPKVNNLNTLSTSGNDIIFVVDNGTTMPPAQYSFIKEAINLISKSTKNRVRVITGSNLPNSLNDATFIYENVDKFMSQSMRCLNREFQIGNGIKNAIALMESTKSADYPNKQIFVLSSKRTVMGDIYNSVTTSINQMGLGYYFNILVADFNEGWPDQNRTSEYNSFLTQFNNSHPSANVNLLTAATISDFETQFTNFFKSSQVYFSNLKNNSVITPLNQITLKGISFNEKFPSGLRFIRSDNSLISVSGDGLIASGNIPDISMTLNNSNIYEGNEVKFSLTFVSETIKNLDFLYGNSGLNIKALASGTNNINLNSTNFYNELAVHLEESNLNNLFEMDLNKYTSIPASQLSPNMNFDMKYTISPKDLIAEDAISNYLHNAKIILVVQATDNYLSSGNKERFDRNIINAFNMVKNDPTNEISFIQASASSTNSVLQPYSDAAISAINSSASTVQTWGLGSVAQKAYDILKLDSTTKKKVIIVVGQDKIMMKSNQLNILKSVAQTVNNSDIIMQLVDLDGNNGTTKYFEAAAQNCDSDKVFVSHLKNDKKYYNNLITVLKVKSNLPNTLTLSNLTFNEQLPAGVLVTNKSSVLGPNINFSSSSYNKIIMPNVTYNLTGEVYKSLPIYITIPMKLTEAKSYVFDQANINIGTYRKYFPLLELNLKPPIQLVGAGLYLPNNPTIITSKKDGDAYVVNIAKGTEYDLGLLLNSLTSSAPNVTFIPSDARVSILGNQTTSLVNLGNANKLIVQKISCNILGEYLIDINSKGIKLGTIKLKVVDMPNVE